jgi:uncharacterized protein YbjQ (UPF0145 family)
VAQDCGVTPVAQVVGLSMGEPREIAALRATGPRQGRWRPGMPRWRENKAEVEAWDAVRRRALERLSEQAKLLRADAVVSISARREHEEAMGVVFTGTAVHVADRRDPKDAKPLLTMASASELWQLLRAGIEPAGIAGAFASVETTRSTATRLARLGPNVELSDLTTAVYEARRLAMDRLMSDARRLKADGLLNVDLTHLHDAGGRQPGVRTTAHLLATAIRRPSRLRGGSRQAVVDLRGARPG